MLDLKENEELIGEYSTYYLIKVKCPDGASYRTTVSKWKPTFKEKVIKYDMEKRLNNKVYIVN